MLHSVVNDYEIIALIISRRLTLNYWSHAAQNKVTSPSASNAVYLLESEDACALINSFRRIW